MPSQFETTQPPTISVQQESTASAESESESESVSTAEDLSWQEDPEFQAKVRWVLNLMITSRTVHELAIAKYAVKSLLLTLVNAEVGEFIRTRDVTSHFVSMLAGVELFIDPCCRQILDSYGLSLVFQFVCFLSCRRLQQAKEKLKHLQELVSSVQHVRKQLLILYNYFVIV